MPTIRPATRDDLPALVGLLRLLFTLEADFSPDEARQRQGLAAMLADQERRAVLVADREGHVAGMVTCQLLISTAEGGPAVLLEDLVVEEVARGLGLGRALVEAAEDWARWRGASRIQLLVDEENHEALAFYRRLKWLPTQLRVLRRFT